MSQAASGTLGILLGGILGEQFGQAFKQRRIARRARHPHGFRSVAGFANHLKIGFCLQKAAQTGDFMGALARASSDVKVTLVDGQYHDVDSSEMAFKIAGSMALQEAARKAKPVLLEPVMAVEVVTPEEFLGDVIGDLSRRRGKVQGQEQRGNALAVQAFVPLGEMFGYATDVRSATQGRASYTMQFERYEEVPKNIEDEIVEHRSGEPVGAGA